MTREQKSAVDAIVSARRGRGKSSPHPSAGPYNALLHSPVVAASCALLGEHVRFGTAVPSALSELAILTVARHWRADYVWAAHASLAVDAGLGQSAVDSLDGGVEPAELSAAEQIVHDFVSQLLRTGRVTPDAFERASAMLGRQGVVDLLATVGYYSLVAFVVNVDRTPIPASAMRDRKPRT